MMKMRSVNIITSQGSLKHSQLEHVFFFFLSKSKIEIESKPFWRSVEQPTFLDERIRESRLLIEYNDMYVGLECMLCCTKSHFIPSSIRKGTS